MQTQTPPDQRRDLSRPQPESLADSARPAVLSGGRASPNPGPGTSTVPREALPPAGFRDPFVEAPRGRRPPDLPYEDAGVQTLGSQDRRVGEQVGRRPQRLLRWVGRASVEPMPADDTTD